MLYAKASTLNAENPKEYESFNQEESFKRNQALLSSLSVICNLFGIKFWTLCMASLGFFYGLVGQLLDLNF